MKYLIVLLSIFFTGCISLSFGGHNGAADHINKERALPHKSYAVVQVFGKDTCSHCDNNGCTPIYCAPRMDNDTLWIQEQK